jgi:hypothetical protein
MATDIDERDDKSAGSEDVVCISAHALGVLFDSTGERIDFEDHGEFVIVLLEDLKRLRRLAFALAQELARYEDDPA